MFQAIRLTFGVLLLSVLFQLSAFASDPAYEQAISDYKSGQYRVALAEFTSYQAQHPANSMIHYYRALCLQNLGQFEKAKEEFRWVSEYGDVHIRPMAQIGLTQLSRAHFSASRPTYNNSVKVATNNSSNQPKGKIKKVLEFYADWCGPCKAFAPVFEEVQSRMRDITFEHHNVDDQSTQSLKEKYPFQSIPHAVFLDANGNVLFSGSPQRDAEGFEQQISQYK